MRQPTAWQVTTTDLNGVRGLVGDLEVEGTKCQVSPVAEKDTRGSLVWVQPYVLVRVHWLPYYIDDEVLRDSLGVHGKIVSITDERGLDGIPNGVKRVQRYVPVPSHAPMLVWGENLYGADNGPGEGAALPAM